MPRKTTPPANDEVPRAHRDKLVPAWAVGVPDPIGAASEELRVGGLAPEAALARRTDADQADRDAARFDEEAATAAIRRGEDPPAVTAPAKALTFGTAKQAVQAADGMVRKAEKALERAIRQHRDPWIVAQRADAAQRIEEGARNPRRPPNPPSTGSPSRSTRSGRRSAKAGGTIDHARRLTGGVLRSEGGRTVPEILAELRDTSQVRCPPRCPPPRRSPSTNAKRSGDGAIG
jgi:hypothetical protein